MPILWRFALFKQWPRIGRSCQTTVLPVLYFWAGHSRTVQVNCLKFLGWTWIFNTVCGWEVTPKVWTGHSVQHLLVYSIDCSSLLFTDFWGWGVTTVVELTLTAYCSKAWTVVHETFLTLPIEFLQVPIHFLHNYILHFVWFPLWHISWHTCILTFYLTYIYPILHIFWHCIWHMFWQTSWYLISHICRHSIWDFISHTVCHNSIWHVIEHKFWYIIWYIYIYTRLYTYIYIYILYSGILFDISPTYILPFHLTFCPSCYLPFYLAFYLTYVLTFYLT